MRSPRIKRTNSLRGSLTARPVSQGGIVGMDGILNDCVVSYQAELQLSQQQVAAVQRAKGPAKIHKLAGILQVPSDLSCNLLYTICIMPHLQPAGQTILETTHAV